MPRLGGIPRGYRRKAGIQTRRRIINYMKAHPWSTAKKIAIASFIAKSTLYGYLRALDAEGALCKKTKILGSSGQHTFVYALATDDGKVPDER